MEFLRRLGRVGLQWLAARYGLEAPVMDLETGARNRVPVAQLIRRTLKEIEPHARLAKLNTEESQQVAARLKGRCAPQACWADDIGAYSLNEVAINWNAPLVWVSGWLAQWQEMLLDADLVVIVVAPNRLKNLRSRYGSAGNKDDGFDAFVLADPLRTDRARLEALSLEVDCDVVQSYLDAIPRELTSVEAFATRAAATQPVA